MAIPKSGTSRLALLDLPLELRTNIYGHICGSSLRLESKHFPSQKPGEGETKFRLYSRHRKKNLMLVCHQICTEIKQFMHTLPIVLFIPDIEDLQDAIKHHLRQDRTLPEAFNQVAYIIIEWYIIGTCRLTWNLRGLGPLLDWARFEASPFPNLKRVVVDCLVYGYTFDELSKFESLLVTGCEQLKSLQPRLKRVEKARDDKRLIYEVSA